MPATEGPMGRSRKNTPFFLARVVGELGAEDPRIRLRLLDEAGRRAPAAPGTRRPGQSAHAEPTQGVFA